MQSIVRGVGDTAGLLFVRSVGELSHAVRAVNELLSRRLAPSWLDPEVLGVFVGRDLDSRLRVPESRSARPCCVCVTLRESVALAGIWSLCWFDLGSAAVGPRAADRRQKLLDDLVASGPGGRTEPGEPRIFLPAFTPAEAQAEVDVLLEELRARYPSLAIGSDCLLTVPACGGLVPY